MNDISRPLRALIVDDEAHAKMIMRALLQRVDPQVEIIGEASNLMEAVDLIHTLSPDIVFMDIEMPGHSGLDIRKYLGSPVQFALVFVTAYDQYAIQAMRISAIDYLLKPLDVNELQECMVRIRARLDLDHDQDIRLKLLEDNRKSNSPVKIAIQTLTETHYLNLEDLMYLEADGMYSVFRLADQKIVASKPIKVYEAMLPKNFFRIHRSYLVNLDFVRQYSSSDSASVVLKNGMELPLARNRREEFLEANQHRDRL